MRNPLKKHIVLAIRLSVGLLILAVIIARLDLERLLETARNASLPLLAFATAAMGFRLVIATERWRVACGSAAKGLSFLNLFVWYMEAAFFNTFLPTVQGGDVVRIWRFASRTGDAAFAFAMVVAERVLALVGIVSLAFAGVLIFGQAKGLPGVQASVAGILVITSIALTVLFNPSICRALAQFSERRGWLKISAFISRSSQAFMQLANRPLALIAVIFYSIMMQLTGIGAIYLVGVSLSIAVDFTYYLVAVPLVWIVLMVPVSINGIGTREAAYVLLLGAVGVSTESAILLSVICAGQMIIYGLLGGVIHLTVTAIERHQAS